MTEPLPPLPEIEHWLNETYTASQMRYYAEAARAPLRKRLDEAIEALDSATMFNEEAERRIAELEAKLALTRERLAVAERKAERAEKDARRYRFLKGIDDYADAEAIFDVIGYGGAEPTLDSVVDKAMEASK